ncbi:MAG: HD domain-containing phosphohydrolase [Candidatus Zixiibacteriota bacterium]
MGQIDHTEIQSHGNANWHDTLSEFLTLARKAVAEFDYERALKHLSTMEELCERKGLPNDSLELRYDLHNEKGRTLSKMGRYCEAVDEYQRLLEFCQNHKLVERRVEVFLEIGQLLAKTGEHDRALGYVHRALSGYRRLNDANGVCRSLRNLGVIYIELGEFDDAEAVYEEAIGISLENNYSLLYADLYNNLGTIKNIKGDWKAALECYYKAREVYDREGEVRKSAYNLNNIGITLMEQEQHENARHIFQSALSVAGTIKDASLLLILNINLCDLSLKVGAFSEAKMHLESAGEYFLKKNLKNGQLVEVEKLAGKIAMQENDHIMALEHFDQALELCEELGLQYLQAEVLFEKGNLFLITEQHMEALQVLESAFRLFHQLDVAGRVEKTEKLIGSIEELYLRIFEAMAGKVDQKDPYTKGHSDRVANIALILARNLGLADHDIKVVVAGALLHDLGKLKTPDEILKKTGRLTGEEYQEIKRHPDAGVQLLSGITLPWDIIPLIRYHHEKYDGTGYPTGLAGEDIPLGARIICLADVFDALTSERPYREAFTPRRALDVMKNEMLSSFDRLGLETLDRLVKEGHLENVINRHTDSDELYKIWAQCRIGTEHETLDEIAPEQVPV